MAGGGCVLILSVFGRGLLVGFRRFRRRCQGGGSIGQSPNSRSRLAVRDAKSKQVLTRTGQLEMDQLEILVTCSSPPPEPTAERNIKSGLDYSPSCETAIIIGMCMRCRREIVCDAHVLFWRLIMTKASLELAMCGYGHFSLVQEGTSADTIEVAFQLGHFKVFMS